MATPAQKNALKGFTKTRKAATAAAKGIYKTVKGDRKAYKNKLLKGYKPSKTVKNLQQKGYGLLNKAENMGDFKYTSKYMPKAEDALETAKDMKFNMKYSLTDDPAYQSYRD